jgi:uncharacterized protein (TIGR03382 family)
MRTKTIVTAGLLSLGVASSASAHIGLTSPKPRPNGDLKTAPCGTAPKGAPVATFEPGEMIKVTWDETIQHPGHFRIAIDSDGEDFGMMTGFDDIKTDLPFDLGNGAMVLVDDIADKTGPVFGNTPYEQMVELPDMECASCTLQVIQVMTDKPPWGNGDDLYFECADITLKRKAGGTAGAGGSAGMAGGGSGGMGGSAGGGAASGMGGMTVAGASGTMAGAAAGGTTGDAPIAGTTPSAGQAAPPPMTTAPPQPVTGAGAPTAPSSSEESGCSVVNAGSARSAGATIAMAWLAATVSWLRRRRRHGGRGQMRA